MDNQIHTRLAAAGNRHVSRGRLRVAQPDHCWDEGDSTQRRRLDEWSAGALSSASLSYPQLSSAILASNEEHTSDFYNSEAGRCKLGHYWNKDLYVWQYGIMEVPQCQYN